MACIISRPTPQALFDRHLNSFSANVLGGSPVVPESNEWYVVSLNYAMAEEFYAISEQAWRETDPRYACCANLIAMAARDGVFPRGASFPQGYAIFSGTPGTALPGRMEIIASNERNYATAGTLPKVMPSSGSVVLRIQDTQPGSAGNSNGSVTSGRLATSVAGLATEVTICGGSLCGGAEAETCEAFRTRYLERKQYQPRATQAWAISKLKEWPCVTRVIPRAGNCCGCDDSEDGCGCKDCGGSLDFYVMFDGAFPCGVAPQNILDEAEEWMFGETKGYGQGQVEIGVCGSLVRPTPFEVDLYIDIAGCPTVSQSTKIMDQLTDLFTTFAPSTDIAAKQAELVVANIIGPGVNVAARYDVVVPDIERATVNQCGDLIVTCDSLPCLRNIIFTGPNSLDGTC